MLPNWVNMLCTSLSDFASPVWMTLVFQLTLYLPLSMTFLVTTLLYSISLWTTFKNYMNDIMWLFVFLYLIWCILFHVLLCILFIHEQFFSLTYTNYSTYIYSLILYLVFCEHILGLLYTIVYKMLYHWVIGFYF